MFRRFSGKPDYDRAVLPTSGGEASSETIAAPIRRRCDRAHSDSRSGRCWHPYWRHPGEPVGLPHALSGLPGTVGRQRRPRLHAFRCEGCSVITLKYGTTTGHRSLRDARTSSTAEAMNRNPELGRFGFGPDTTASARARATPDATTAVLHGPSCSAVGGDREAARSCDAAQGAARWRRIRIPKPASSEGSPPIRSTRS
jgi:hypothetical protein